MQDVWWLYLFKSLYAYSETAENAHNVLNKCVHIQLLHKTQFRSFKILTSRKINPKEIGKSWHVIFFGGGGLESYGTKHFRLLFLFLVCVFAHPIFFYFPTKIEGLKPLYKSLSQIACLVRLKKRSFSKTILLRFVRCFLPYSEGEYRWGVPWLIFPDKPSNFF